MSAEARRRAQAALMDAGGDYGFTWSIRRIGDGAVFIAHAPDEYRVVIEVCISDWFMLRVSPPMPRGDEWLISEWCQPLTSAQMEEMNAWRSARLTTAG